MRHFSSTSSFARSQRPRVVAKLRNTVPSDPVPSQPLELNGCCGFSRVPLWEKAHCGTQHGLMKIATSRAQLDKPLYTKHLRPAPDTMKNASRTAAFVHLFMPEAAVNWKAKSSTRGKTAFAFLLLTVLFTASGLWAKTHPVEIPKDADC